MQGWRIGYLSTSHLFDDDIPRFYTLWLRDDDVGYRTGCDTLIDSQDNVDYYLQWLRDNCARPLSVTYTRADDRGLVCITWIKDGRFADENDWMVIRIPANDMEAAYAEYHAYRPIWCSLNRGAAVLTLIRDSYGLPWAIRIASFNTWNDSATETAAVADVVTSPANAGTRPICVECKGIPVPSPTEIDFGFNPPAEYQRTWILLFAYDPDLDPFEGTVTHCVKFPSATDAATARDNSRRIDVFAAIPEANLLGAPGAPTVDSKDDVRFAVIEIPSPVPRCRRVDGPVDVPIGDGLDPDDAANVSNGIDAVVFDYMEATRSPALSLAIRDSSGVRLNRAYTRAPWAYRDTRPESQFRIGSLSKTVTGIALVVLLQDLFGDRADVALEIPAFTLPELPSDYRMDRSTAGYTSEIEQVTLRQLLTHFGGFVQATFDPAASPTVIVESVVNAGLALGGWSFAGKGRLPLLRHDYLQYMTRGFLGNRQRDSDIDARLLLSLRTGWSAESVDVFNYSGFGYDWIGMLIEALTGPVSPPRSNAKSYADFVNLRILKPIGATSTVPGRTTRGLCGADEVTYVGGSYLELASPPIASANTFASSQVSLRDDSVWYSSDDYPDDADWGPPRPTKPYGGDFYSLEAGLAGGGWVSTPHDLCRIVEVLRGATGVISPANGDLAASVVADANAVGFAPGCVARFGALANGRDSALCAALWDWNVVAYNPLAFIEAILDVFDV